jgi:hypothetical protein
MPKIPRRFSHFVYGVIQSGLTAGIATAMASTNALGVLDTHLAYDAADRDPRGAGDP